VSWRKRSNYGRTPWVSVTAAPDPATTRLSLVQAAGRSSSDRGLSANHLGVLNGALHPLVAGPIVGDTDSCASFPITVLNGIPGKWPSRSGSCG
jgi:hypothetical protein